MIGFMGAQGLTRRKLRWSRASQRAAREADISARARTEACGCQYALKQKGYTRAYVASGGARRVDLAVFVHLVKLMILEEDVCVVVGEKLRHELVGVYRFEMVRV